MGPDKKTVWNLHLLDKLYFVNHQDNSVDDTPVMKMEIDGRCISINDMTMPIDESGTNHLVHTHESQENRFFYFNKEDAENALGAWSLQQKTLNQ